MAVVLSQLSIGQVFDQLPTLVSVNSNATIGEALSTLAKHRVYAIPVLDNGNGVGYVDLLSVVKGICALVGKVTPLDLSQKAKGASSCGEQFLSGNATSLLDNTQNPYTRISFEASVKEAVQALTGSARRVALTGTNGEVITIVSASCLVRALAYYVNDSSIREILAHKTVGDVCERSVVTVESSEYLINVAHRMVETGKSSAAIMENNRLISVVSLKDFLCFNEAKNWNKLFMPVSEFVTEIRRVTPKAIFPAISAHETDNLERVLLRFAATRIHRVFVVNAQEKLCGVISQRDLLRTLV